MAITPVELRNMSFERKFRGYIRSMWTQLLPKRQPKWKKLIDANAELQRQMKNLEERLISYQTIEQSLKQTLLTAQQAAEATQRAANGIRCAFAGNRCCLQAT